MTDATKRTFYLSPNGHSYHRDRQCWFLRIARQYDKVRAFEAADPGVGQVVWNLPPATGPRSYPACKRCGV